MWKEILKRQQKLYKPTPQVDLDLQSIDGLEFNPDILAESRKREDSRQLEEKRRQFQSKREGMKKLGQKTLDIEKAPLPEISFTEREIDFEWEYDLPTIRDFINDIDKEDPAVLLQEPSVTETPPDNPEEFNPKGGKINVQTWLTFTVSKKIANMGEEKLREKLNPLGYTLSTRPREVEYAGQPDARQYYIGVKSWKVKKQGKKYPNRISRLMTKKPRNVERWIEHAKDLGLISGNGEFNVSKYKELLMAELDNISQNSWVGDIRRFYSGTQEKTFNIMDKIFKRVNSLLESIIENDVLKDDEGPTLILYRLGRQHIYNDLYDVLIDELKNAINDKEHFDNSIRLFKGHLKPFKQSFVESFINIALSGTLRGVRKVTREVIEGEQWKQEKDEIINNWIEKKKKREGREKEEKRKKEVYEKEVKRKKEERENKRQKEIARRDKFLARGKVNDKEWLKNRIQALERELVSARKNRPKKAIQGLERTLREAKQKYAKEYGDEKKSKWFNVVRGLQ